MAITNWEDELLDFLAELSRRHGFCMLAELFSCQAQQPGLEHAAPCERSWLCLFAPEGLYRRRTSTRLRSCRLTEYHGGWQITRPFEVRHPHCRKLVVAEHERHRGRERLAGRSPFNFSVCYVGVALVQSWLQGELMRCSRSMGIW